MDNGDWLTNALLYFSLCFGSSVILLWAVQTTKRRASWPAGVALVCGGAMIASLALHEAPARLVPLVLVAIALSVAARRPLRGFTPAGVLNLVTLLLVLATALPWGIRFVATIPVSGLTRTLMFVGYPFMLVAVPSALVQLYESWEILWRDSWERPRSSLAPTPRDRYPMVSIHVPVHAEPPEVVIATLDSLAAIQYPNVEVLVVDNNTSDPALWKPVEAHCLGFGGAFRFFHVEGLSGAKAGALNLALSLTAPEAEIIGVVDADYVVRPDFLSRLIGHFDDPGMGFLQPPHDYRGWEGSSYLRACYWEYQYFFRTTMVSLNERNAALTVGTMCLIRRRALEEAGGWAEWCVTEDSELAIRIHALGYSSVYLIESFGRGLIPETFIGYKRQRFRWTYGPVQELKRHVRLFLPRRWARPSDLTTGQKVHHFNHGWDRAAIGLGFLTLPIGAAVIASMLVHREIVTMPFVLWLTFTILLAASVALRGLLYRTVIGSSMADALRAALATKALSHTITMASLRAVFTETTPWRRTDKFPARPSPRRALRSAAVETALAVVSLGVALLAWVLVPEPGLLLMLAIGAVLQSGRYFSAALLALGSEWDLARRERAPTRLSVLDRLASRVTARGRRLPVRLGKVILAATATVAVVGAVILVMRLAAFSLHPTQGLTAQPPASRPASPHDLSTSGIGVGSGSSGKSLVAALSGRGPGSSHQEAGSRRSGFGGPPDSIPKPPPHPGPVPVPPGSPRPPGSPPHRGTPGQQGQPPGQ